MVGGATIYVHPIRIMFYDRRVIMCAVMLIAPIFLNLCVFFRFSFVFVHIFSCCFRSFVHSFAVRCFVFFFSSFFSFSLARCRFVYV